MLVFVKRKEQTEFGEIEQSKSFLSFRISNILSINSSMRVSAISIDFLNRTQPFPST